MQNSPRIQHYTFAHDFIKQIINQEPMSFYQVINKGHGKEVFVKMWEQMSILFDDIDSSIDINQLNVETRDFDNYYTFIVHMPTPITMGEAHCVAVFIDKHSIQKNSYWYFTLEKSFDIRGESDTAMIGQWINDQHLNHGKALIINFSTIPLLTLN